MTWPNANMTQNIKRSFTYIEDRQGQKPQCVVCSEVLANNSINPLKLEHHLITKHIAHAEKLVAFFQREVHKHRESQKSMNRHSHYSPYCKVKENPHY